MLRATNILFIMFVSLQLQGYALRGFQHIDVEDPDGVIPTLGQPPAAVLRNYIELAQKSEAGDAPPSRSQIEIRRAQTSYTELLSKAAEEGDIKAQATLGWMYENGEGIDKSFKKAVKWYRKAAEQGHAEAQAGLGRCYYNGTGVSQDYEQAVVWYRKAAEQNHTWAQASLAYYYEMIDQDFREAIKWYEKAAVQGDAVAQCNLGRFYESGHGTAEDYKLAIYWYLRAAKQGTSAAQNDLGRCYAIGIGIPTDFVTAYHWFNVAAVTDPNAAMNRDILAQRMTPEQVAEGQRLSAGFVAVIEGNPLGTTPGIDPPNVKPRDQAKGTGTAFMVDGNGYALTAAHVVIGATKIEIVKDGKQFPAAVFVMDAANDVAVIKVERAATTILPVASSSEVTLGAGVFTIGFPNISVQGSSPKLTKGEINSLAGIQDDPRFFQVSVAIQPGNSGGPLINERGEVTGIIVSQLDQGVSLETSGALQQNVNYAVKSAYFLPLLDSIPGFTAKRANEKQKPVANIDEAIRNAEAATVIVLSY